MGAVFAAALLAITPAGRSAFRKIEGIERGQYRPGSVVLFTPAEINGWLGQEAKYYAQPGITDPRIELSDGRIVGTVQIDFARLSESATGEAPGWIARNLFSGSHPVKAILRIESRNGQARVDIERVEISGVPVEGRALDYLIQTYFRPAFPEARISEWFEMDDSLDHFTVTPQGIAVHLSRHISRAAADLRRSARF